MNEIKIKEMIYEIRGKQVMLDSDSAKLYECTNGTKDINRAVKRNVERFPEDFYFRLTEEEDNVMRFHFGTSLKKTTKGGRTYLPYVFTEQGVAMLATVIKNTKAAEVSVDIMRAFVYMRKIINNSSIIFEKFKLQYEKVEIKIVVLRKIGTDEKMINRSLFNQIGIFFLVPLFLAVVHSIFGIQCANIMLTSFGQSSMLSAIIMTAVFVVVIYGGYFLVTYFSSKRIIKEQEK